MKTSRSSAWGLGWLAIALVVSPARADAPLRWKFAAGQTYAYEVTQKSETKLDAQGQKINTTMTQVMEMSWEVKSVDADGSAAMTQTLDRIKLIAEGPGGKLEFDTADPKAPEGPLAAVAPLFQAMAKAPIALRMSARGEISDVKLPAKMIEGFKTAGANAPAAGDILSEKSLQNLISQSSIALPEAAISKGDHWTASRKIDVPFGVMMVDNTYTYQGKAGPLEKFGITSKIGLQPKADLPVEIKLDGQDSEGSFTFDSAAGAMKSSAIVLKMNLLLTVMGKPLKQEVISSVSMESKPATSPKSSE